MILFDCRSICASVFGLLVMLVIMFIYIEWLVIVIVFGWCGNLIGLLICRLVFGLSW